MKRLLTALLMMSLALLIGCTNSSQKNNSSSEEIQEIQQIDSLTTELEETDTEIQEKIDALESTLDDL